MKKKNKLNWSSLTTHENNKIWLENDWDNMNYSDDDETCSNDTSSYDVNGSDMEVNSDDLEEKIKEMENDDFGHSDFERSKSNICNDLELMN